MSPDKDKNGQPIEVKITDTDRHGNGRARHGGRTYHLPFTLPGEIVQPRTVVQKKQQYFGYPENISKRSPLRVPSDCIHFGSCAGCLWRHIPYEQSFEQKLKLVSEDLADVPLPALIGHKAHSIFHYRTKSRFYIQDGKLTQNTLWEHDPFSVKECQLTHFQTLDIAEYFLKNVPELVSIEITSTQKGDHIILLESPHIPTITELPYSLYQLWEQNLYHIQGPKHISFELFVQKKHLVYTVGPQDFFQNNVQVTEELLGLLALSIPHSTETITELYGGVGTIGIAIASFFPKAQVTSLERSHRMVEIQSHNAKSNGVSLTSILQDLSDDVSLAHCDVLIVDPPRKGLHSTVHSAIEHSLPKTLLYVSCDHNSFGRDATMLSKHYQCKELHYFDMMPFTRHGELLGVFTLKG